MNLEFIVSADNVNQTFLNLKYVSQKYRKYIVHVEITNYTGTAHSPKHDLPKPPKQLKSKFSYVFALNQKQKLTIKVKSNNEIDQISKDFKLIREYLMQSKVDKLSPASIMAF